MDGLAVAGQVLLSELPLRTARSARRFGEWGRQHQVDITPVGGQDSLAELGYPTIARQRFERGFRVLLHCPRDLSRDRLGSLLDEVVRAVKEL